jgi:predicted ABC-type ATPase
MSATTAKKIIIIAGPKSAGKTTFAREFLPTDEACLNFFNADLIAAGLSPFNPEAAAIQAGRLMLLQIAEHLKHGRSFALETTLSGLGYARQIHNGVWQATRWRCTFWLCQMQTWP